MIVVGASAYSRIIDFPRFQQIAQSVGAYLLVDMAHISGLVATGLHPSPVPYADFVTTTTHKTLRGPRAGIVMCKEEHAKAVDKTIFPGLQGGPLMHVIAAKAVGLKEALAPEFKAYQQRVLANATSLAEGFKSQGYHVVSGGTETHLFLLNLNSTAVTGKEAEAALDASGIIVNKNAVPYDERPPAVASGIRMGDAHRVHARDGVIRDGSNRGVDRRGVTCSRRETNPASNSKGSQDSVCTLPRLFGLVTRRSFLLFKLPMSRQFSVNLPRRRCLVMRCPFCTQPDDKVIDSRTAREGEVIRRRRECLECKRRFTTYERIEENLPMVVKKDNRRQAFDRKKVMAGLQKACEKRPISREALDTAVDRIEKRLQDVGESEIPARKVGDAVMQELHAFGPSRLRAVCLRVPGVQRH